MNDEFNELSSSLNRLDNELENTIKQKLLQGLLKHEVFRVKRDLPRLVAWNCENNQQIHAKGAITKIKEKEKPSSIYVDKKEIAHTSQKETDEKETGENITSIVKETNETMTREINENTQTHRSRLEELNKLKNELQQIDHPLRYLSNNLVFSSDPDNAREYPILLIGEAPGEEEDKQARPFVGTSGQLLEQILNSIDLKRNKEFYIINMIPFRPQANRTPTPKEIEFFMPYVQRHILLANPKLIILVGASAYKGFIKNIIKNSESKASALPLTISNARGEFFKLKIQNIEFDTFVVFHPSYLPRVPSAKQIMWNDMLKLKKWLINQNILEIK